MGLTGSRRGLAALVVGAHAIGALGLLSACGDDGGERRRALLDTPTSAAGPAKGAVVAAYEDWVAALVARDASAACDLQAPDYTIALRAEAILAHRAELGDPCVGFEALVWEDPGFDGDVVDVAVTQQTEEDALLAVRLASRSLTVRMVHDRARWRVYSTTDRAEGTGDPTGGESSSGPARWLTAWCALSPDDTRAEIIAAMGEPSGEYTVSDGGEPQLWWAQDQYDFRAYLDVDDSVLELVGDYDALSADDRAQLPCPELRS